MGQSNSTEQSSAKVNQMLFSKLYSFMPTPWPAPSQGMGWCVEHMMSCTSSVSHHLKRVHVSYRVSYTEIRLHLSRIGIFEYPKNLQDLTICTATLQPALLQPPLSPKLEKVYLPWFPMFPPSSTCWYLCGWVTFSNFIIGHLHTKNFWIYINFDQVSDHFLKYRNKSEKDSKRSTKGSKKPKRSKRVQRSKNIKGFKRSKKFQKFLKDLESQFQRVQKDQKRSKWSKLELFWFKMLLSI